MERALIAAGRQIGFLGLGSNVGDSAANLRAAASALESAGVSILARASIYVTAPQGEVLDQPDFFNSALKIETDLKPLELLDLCKQIERDQGRDPDGVRHGPRPIDIDVLMLGDEPFESERLTLPHREISSRRFVLEPLLEIAPDFVLPNGTTAASLLPSVEDQPVKLLEAL